MPIKKNIMQLTAVSFLFAAGCQVASPAKPAGARTPEEAMETLAKATSTYDALLFAKIIDASTDEGKTMVELAPSSLRGWKARDLLHSAISEKYGESAVAEASCLLFPPPAKLFPQILARAYAVKHEQTKTRMTLDTGYWEKLTFAKTADGDWKLQPSPYPRILSKEAIEKRDAFFVALSTRMLAKLAQCPTPEICAKTMQIEVENLRKEGAEISEIILQKRDIVIPVEEDLDNPPHQPPAKNATQLLVTVEADGSISYYGETLALAELTAKLKAAVLKDPGRPQIVIAAKDKAKWQDVVAAFNAATAADIGDVSFSDPSK